jgi:hypothetical protein
VQKQKIPPCDGIFKGLCGFSDLPDVSKNNPGCYRSSDALKPAVVQVRADKLRDERRVVGQHNVAFERFEAKIFHPAAKGTVEKGSGLICVGFGFQYMQRPFGFQQSSRLANWKMYA